MFFSKIKRLLVGAPKDIDDKRLFHQVSLIAFFAWVGLGSDGLSSSAYGPDAAFRTLGEEHRYMAVFLALAIAFTVFVISFSYSRIIEHFPTGGGGYVVATKLLGTPAGLVSGSALLIDYVLTITVSIAAAGDAIFAFLPQHKELKLPIEYAAIVLLIVLNLRGVKESITVLLPIFFLFISTHAVMLLAAFIKHAGNIPTVAHEVSTHVQADLHVLGLIPMFLLFAKAYSMGAGTFTGIEAVSNGLAIMRDPKVETGKRTMLYMGLSLAITAGGIMLAYLLFDVKVDPADKEKPLNAVLLENLARESSFFGNWFVVLTLIAEGALLLIAAQTGFIGGPRTMANMALDSWLPHRFSSLSERLTTHYGIVLMGGAATLALWYTQGIVTTLVTMYSINVFITFCLAQLGMCKFCITDRKKYLKWKRELPIFLTGLLLCVSILLTVVIEKFGEGAWVTLLVTSLMIGFCVLIRRYYTKVYSKLGLVPVNIETPKDAVPAPAQNLDIHKPTAVLLVGSYGPLGIHALAQLRRLFGDHFQQIIFVSVGVVDAGNFKGATEMDALKAQTEEALGKYVATARQLGMMAASMMAVGNEPVEPAAELCIEAALRYKQAMFFAGKLVFQKETLFQRLLHNETAIAIQNRLQWLGYPMLVLPIRVWGVGKRVSGRVLTRSTETVAGPETDEP